MLEKLTRIFEEIYALSLKPVLMKIIKETDSMLIHISQSWNGGIFPHLAKQEVVVYCIWNQFTHLILLLDANADDADNSQTYNSLY